MKRVIAVFCLIVAATLIGHAQMRPDKLPPLITDAIAGPPAMLQVAGAGVAAGCSSTQENFTDASNTLSIGNGTNYAYAAFSIEASGAYTVYSLTTKMRRVGCSSGCGDVHMYLCTTDGASNPNERPTSTCTEADATISASTLATGGGEKTVTWNAGWGPVTSGQRYWVKTYIDGTTDASNYMQLYYNATNGPLEYILRSTDNTPTWASQDADCLAYHIVSSCAP